MSLRTKRGRNLPGFEVAEQPSKSGEGAVPPGKARLLQLSATVLMLVLIASAGSFGQHSNFAKPATDLPPGAMQSKASTACTECHEARIILQQRLSKAAWTKEVDKMIKWGAFVEPNDRDALIDYLSSNFSVDQPQYQPSRTSTEKKSSAQSK